MNLFLFLAIAFFASVSGGYLLRRFGMPWIFAAMIFGMAISFFNLFSAETSSETFQFLSLFGMYSFLFIIGFEINLKKMLEKSPFYLRSTLFIILLEGLLGSIAIHYLFSYPWLPSLLVALSFATVGETVLLPLLEKKKLLKTELGQTILGIGLLSNIMEILLILFVSIFVAVESDHIGEEILLTFGILLLLLILSISLTKLRKKHSEGSVPDVHLTFVFVLFAFLLFVGIGLMAQMAAMAALLAGIAMKNFLPEQRVEGIESELKSLTYGFFGPLFFISVGLDLSFSALFQNPVALFIIAGIMVGSKILGSMISGMKELGFKKSLILGIGISIKFGTGIVLIKLLSEKGIIGQEIYSILIASSLIFMLLVPPIFSALSSKWLNK
jgi:P-type Ca2+ transporter type 2C